MSQDGRRAGCTINSRGGFHRYSVDAKWLVPHFEKMLYDNALLSRLYLHVYQLTRDEFYRRIAEEILDYVVREMTDSSGGFYSSQDADSEGEGQVLCLVSAGSNRCPGPAGRPVFSDYYDVTERMGISKVTTFFTLRLPLRLLALKHGVSVDRAAEIIEARSTKTIRHSRGRVKPGRDERFSPPGTV